MMQNAHISQMRPHEKTLRNGIHNSFHENDVERLRSIKAFHIISYVTSSFSRQNALLRCSLITVSKK